MVCAAHPYQPTSQVTDVRCVSTITCNHARAHPGKIVIHELQWSPANWKRAVRHVVGMLLQGLMCRKCAAGVAWHAWKSRNEK